MNGQEARDDEREALAQVIANAFFAMQAGQEWDAEDATYEQPVPNAGDMDLAVSILAAGYRRHQAPEITDEMVERAAQAAFDEPWAYKRGDEYTWAELIQDEPERADLWREDARAVLEAALRVRQ